MWNYLNEILIELRNEKMTITVLQEIGLWLFGFCCCLGLMVLLGLSFGGFHFGP